MRPCLRYLGGEVWALSARTQPGLNTRHHTLRTTHSSSPLSSNLQARHSHTPTTDPGGTSLRSSWGTSHILHVQVQAGEWKDKEAHCCCLRRTTDDPDPTPTERVCCRCAGRSVHGPKDARLHLPCYCRLVASGSLVVLVWYC